MLAGLIQYGVSRFIRDVIFSYQVPASSGRKSYYGCSQTRLQFQEVVAYNYSNHGAEKSRHSSDAMLRRRALVTAILMARAESNYLPDAVQARSGYILCETVDRLATPW